MILFFLFNKHNIYKTSGQNSNINTDKIGTMEGDIMVPKVNGKNVYLKANKWPNGIVKYKIDSSFTTNQKQIIINSMRLMESQTSNCIKFVERTTETNYVLIRNTNYGCYSYIGMIGGVQELSLQYNFFGSCLYQPTIMHELMHALGFLHEQSRPDRNSYVNILWQNINPSYYQEFVFYSNQIASTLNQPYDVASVMHYSRTAFSKNGLPTISAKDSNLDKSIASSTLLTPLDVKKIKLYYNCPV